MIDDLKQQQETLLLKMQKLKEKKNLALQKRLFDLGKLAQKAKLLELDDIVLLGAFYEIAERKGDESAIKSWIEKANAKNKQEESKEKDNTRLSVSFKNPPPKEAKAILKKMKFRWNSFRGEYYGFGNRESLARLLDGTECNIETLS